MTLLRPDGSTWLAPAWEEQLAAAISVPVAGRRVLVGPPEEDLLRMLLLGEVERTARPTASLPPGALLRPGYCSLRLSAAASAAR